MESNHFDPPTAIAAARTGNSHAVAFLIDHYRPYLRLLAKVSINRNIRSKLDESDVVQDASLLAARDLPKFLGATEAELASWLRTILAHVVANAHRHYGRERRDVDVEQRLKTEMNASSDGMARLISAESTPSHHVVRRERAVILAEALEELPVDYREVLTLRELEGFSLAEIAVQLGKTPNAVQKMWARAIKEMRRILKEIP